MKQTNYHFRTHQQLTEMKEKIEFLKELQSVLDALVPIAEYLMAHNADVDLAMPFITVDRGGCMFIHNFPMDYTFCPRKIDRTNEYKIINMAEFKDFATKENVLGFFNSDFLIFDAYLKHIQK